MPKSRLKCFCIERTDLPAQWRDKDGKECESDDPNRSVGTPRYRRLDTNEIVVGAPPGAVFYYEDITGYESKYKGPDGKSLVVVLPTGEWWFPDAPASNGHWTRTGEIPDTIDVKASIQTEKYHGFLNHGWLEEC